jgi:hypothetical protein
MQKYWKGYGCLIANKQIYLQQFGSYGANTKSDQVGTWFLHIFLTEWTFDKSLIKFIQGVQKIWTGHKIHGSNLQWPWPWAGQAGTWVLHIILMGWTFDPSFMIFIPGFQKICTGHKIHGSNLLTLLVTLTLSRPGWNMGYAHRLHRLSIWLKFHEILSRGSEDMNRTQNTWSSNTTGDLDLEPAMLEHGFYLSSCQISNHYISKLRDQLYCMIHFRLPESWKIVSDIRSGKMWTSVGPKQILSDQNMLRIK